ncbi:L-rhamnose mutarotase [Cohnella ginsengisoli]|uniref:L-rhamnose mutarotase n=1 Tax=Cohnella ginsengisoli TaxID=425004 RepID=A0A9X4KLF4_9BACL|nr:L-rhamnose mutarotase [Cohnella ginsengisoli]MDG0791820.1 L-rhamnose mutarotase [Cohnella ginsengisoli]
MIERSLWVATLRADKVEDYERLHARLPAEIAAQLGDKGFVRLDIYRHGLALFMTWEVDPGRAKAGRIVRESAERAWDRLTGDCFAESWRQVPLLFRLSDHLHKASQLEGQGAD